MLTQEAVLEAVRAKTIANALDGRDAVRLADFFDVKDWPALGVSPKPCDEHDDCRGSKDLARACAMKRVEHTPRPWTREAVLEQLRDDVAFGLEKALGRRGLSASAMHSVVCMWLTVLEDDEIDREDYAQYGLPVFRAVALKYGFQNPIGNDRGDEAHYAEDSDA